jgi:hypothetical protein
MVGQDWDTTAAASHCNICKFSKTVVNLMEKNQIFYFVLSEILSFTFRFHDCFTF